MGLTTFQKWAAGSLMIIAAIFVIYISFAVLGEGTVNEGLKLDINLDEESKKIVMWTIIILIVSGTATIIFVNLFKRRKTEDYAEELELPKKPVDLDRALEIWTEAFMIKTGIVVRRQVHINKKNPPLVTQKGIFVRTMNETSFSSRETGDNYCIFEVLTNAGRKRGLNVFCIKTDAGEEWIKNNWQWRNKEKISLNRFKLDERNYPLNTSQSNQERLLNMQFEATLSGDYSAEEIRMFETARKQLSNQNKNSEKTNGIYDDEERGESFTPQSEEEKTDAQNSVNEAKQQAREEQSE